MTSATAHATAHGSTVRPAGSLKQGTKFPREGTTTYVYSTTGCNDQGMTVGLPFKDRLSTHPTGGSARRQVTPPTTPASKRQDVRFTPQHPGPSQQGTVRSSVPESESPAGRQVTPPTTPAPKRQDMRPTPPRPAPPQQGPSSSAVRPVSTNVSKKAAAREAARISMAALRASRKANETPEQKEARLKQDRDRKAAAQAEETLSQRQARQQADRRHREQSRATESASQTQSRQQANRIRMAQSRAAESAE